MPVDEQVIYPVRFMPGIQFGLDIRRIKHRRHAMIFPGCNQQTQFGIPHDGTLRRIPAADDLFPVMSAHRRTEQAVPPITRHDPALCYIIIMR